MKREDVKKQIGGCALRSATVMLTLCASATMATGRKAVADIRAASAPA